jgi:hypothetical protein
MRTANSVARLRRLVLAPALVLSVYLPTRQSIVTWTPQAAIESLWDEPGDLRSANLFDGPWGGTWAPDPDATFTFLRPTDHGVNSGVIVTDPIGREWHVKQHTNNDARADGHVEVVVSRVLSAVGYYQPPVYFLSSFTMTTGEDQAAGKQPGGRFRFHTPLLENTGSWAWEQNPFVGTRPYKGLLVILLLFNSTDLKDSNNGLYRVSFHGAVEHWYVVRDLGAALGETARLSPRGDDVARYERSRFIVGVKNGFVEFANQSSFQRLFQHRITVDDVRWAGDLLARLTDRQWHDAFRAGGYAPDVADRFVSKIQSNIKEAQSLGGADRP